MGNKIFIKYCVPCGFEKAAKTLESELRSQFSNEMDEIILQPSKLIGKFDVYLNGDLIFEKRSAGHLPLPGEVEMIVMQKKFSRG